MTPLRKAIEAAQPYGWNGVLDPNDPAHRSNLRNLVLAVLRSVRTPDMQMVRDVAEQIGVQPSTVDIAYTHMIDAILREKS